MFSEQHCTQILEEHQIKPTANRILVVRALAAAMHPISLAELEMKILTIDKSSIFRTLNLFRQSHLVHVIEGSSDCVRYELCHSQHTHSDDDLHPHFYCERCQRTFCLDNATIPSIPLPEGYEMHSINYVVKGICPECS
jgi:Fur family ferric uptake transcriptional regulator